ncbi:hypothetical protein CYMTET_46983 [Cymbomonas tetramitiformis]|uniref:Uncharacterized protein n=1 Tax=Cymbomonas tetramitiformis TaxID=36881 RepID=A0AAE0BV57_9CHLO|nr:hypothetical protein CYMTET_46983 [Cymbomonas tetramitiformis]
MVQLRRLAAVLVVEEEAGEGGGGDGGEAMTSDGDEGAGGKQRYQAMRLVERPQAKDWNSAWEELGESRPPRAAPQNTTGGNLNAVLQLCAAEGSAKFWRWPPSPATVRLPVAHLKSKGTTKAARLQPYLSAINKAGEENWLFLTHHKLRMVLFELAKSASPLPSALPDDFTGCHTYLPDHSPDLTVLHHAKGPRTASYLRCSTGADDGNCAPCGSCDGSGASSKEAVAAVAEEVFAGLGPTVAAVGVECLHSGWRCTGAWSWHWLRSFSGYSGQRYMAEGVAEEVAEGVAEEVAVDEERGEEVDDGAALHNYMQCKGDVGPAALL